MNARTTAQNTNDNQASRPAVALEEQPLSDAVITKGGFSQHPLYLPWTAEPVPYLKAP